MVHRFVSLMILIGFAIVPVSAASPSVLYESPHTELTYGYTSRDEGSKGQSWFYRVPTDEGMLKLKVLSDEARFMVVTDVEGAKSREIVTSSSI